MPTVETNGIETYYERHGEGPPVVFVHGSSLDFRQWTPQIESLTNQYEVIVYDIRGHGRSGRARDSYSSRAVLADDLVALVDALDLDQPVVVGCSLGGRVAYVYAARYPDSLAGLVTLEASPVAGESPPLPIRILARLFPMLMGVVGAERMTTLYYRLEPALGDADEWEDTPIRGLNMTKGEYKRATAALLDTTAQQRFGRADKEPVDLSSINVPTLVLTGDDPSDVFADTAETLTDEIPDSERRRVPDAGHAANFENPDAFDDILRDFLDDCW